MSSLYDINSLCLRYIVPFKLEESFKDAFKKVESLSGRNKKNNVYKLWERKKSTLDGPESDLYAYVRNEFCFDDDSENLSEQKVGCEWLFWRSNEASGKDGKRIKELIYYPNGIKNNKKDEDKKLELPRGWQITISNVGLILFRNGLGIIWYELKIPQDGVDSNQLKSFQNIIRELNRGEATLLWEKQMTNTKPDYGIMISEHKNKEGEMSTIYLRPFLFGNWISETINFLHISYFAERKSAYASMLKKSMSGLKGSNVFNKDNQENLPMSNLPDKAILFTYASFGEREIKGSVEDKYSLIFHITNGYKDSYHVSDKLTEEIKYPFDNVYWYVTQEGAAYLAWSSSDNKEVFNSLIPSKVRTDYFALYIKTLYQSFSLLIYAEKIQEEISAINEKYLDEPLGKRITALFGEINLFLTKSMATSVSHIHHQSEFYVYLKKQLRIHEDIKSVTSGLNALDMLQREQRQREESQRVKKEREEEQRREREAQEVQRKREKREKKSEEKTQAIMGLFALLGISSALTDCFDFIGKFNIDADPSKQGDFWNFSPITQWWEIAFFIIIGIISILAICVSGKAIIDAFRDNDKKNKKDDLGADEK